MLTINEQIEFPFRYSKNLKSLGHTGPECFDCCYMETGLNGALFCIETGFKYGRNITKERPQKWTELEKLLEKEDDEISRHWDLIADYYRQIGVYAD